MSVSLHWERLDGWSPLPMLTKTNPKQKGAEVREFINANVPGSGAKRWSLIPRFSGDEHSEDRTIGQDSNPCSKASFGPMFACVRLSSFASWVRAAMNLDLTTGN